MFNKPFKVKSKSALKGSDRKKLKAAVEVQLPGIDISWCLSGKTALSATKVYTHSGLSVIVYNIDNMPIFFETRGGRVFPTVYTLWEHQKAGAEMPTVGIPSFQTWPPVLEKLTNGADFMLPGVVDKELVRMHTLDSISKGCACGISAVGNGATVVVGEATMSGEDMYLSGMRGKGVSVLHVHGDYLWASGEKTNPPNIPDVFGLSLAGDNKKEDVDNASSTGIQRDINYGSNSRGDSAVLVLRAAGGTAVSGSDRPTGQRSLGNNESVTMGDPSVTMGDPSGGNIGSLSDKLCEVSVRSERDPDTGLMQSESISRDVHQQKTETVDINERDGGDDDFNGSDTGAEAVQLSAEDHESLLKQCFLCALKSRVKKGDVPVLSNLFFKNFVMVCCPPDRKLEVKKTKYKKLSKFLSAMMTEGFLTIKETSPGVETVLDVNRAHPEVRSFRLEWDVAPQEPPVQRESSEFSPPVISELYAVSSATMPIFSKMGYRKGAELTLSQIRDAITQYVRHESLLNETDRRLITLDPILTSSLVARNEGYVENLTWESLFKRCSEKMNLVHSIKYANGRTITRKGPIKPVTIRVESRASNKRVTLIEHLETFGVDPSVLAKVIRLGKACSTSVGALPGKQQQQQQQLLVQGDHSSYILKLLKEKYGIGQKYLQCST